MTKAVFTHRDMEEADLEYIMAEMWGPGAAEFDLIGITDAKALMTKICTTSDRAWAFLADGNAVAICGVQKDEEGTYYTWFMATPSIAEVGGEFTLWLRGFCREKVEQGDAESSEVKLEMRSASQHPNSDRWFKALRFEKYAEEGIFKFYRYNPKNKLTTSAK
jgi:hypothetical protein